MPIACWNRLLICLSLTAAVGAAASGQTLGQTIQVGYAAIGADADETCFAAGFLASAARETDIDISRQLHPVELGDDALFEHPFLVLTGRGPFELTDTEAANLRRHVEQGGFILASAGCSDPEWAASFRENVLPRVWGEPDEAIEPLSSSHELFTTLYEIDRVQSVEPTDEPPLLGLTRQGGLTGVFTELGLNDTEHAGEQCRCCSGNEILNARWINANILLYALMR